jgi:hypothetical protein
MWTHRTIRTQKKIHDDFTKKWTKLKTINNRKNPIVDIGKLVYKTTELEWIFGSRDFGRDQPQIYNSTKRHLFNEVIGIFGLPTNSNLELLKNNSSLEYPIKYSTP